MYHNIFFYLVKSVQDFFTTFLSYLPVSEEQRRKKMSAAVDLLEVSLLISSFLKECFESDRRRHWHFKTHLNKICSDQATGDLKAEAAAEFETLLDKKLALAQQRDWSPRPWKHPPAALTDRFWCRMWSQKPWTGEKSMN